MYEIIVSINGEQSSLDIGQEIGFGINYAINDVGNGTDINTGIFTRQTTITKNIKLPATEYNKKIFQSINLLSSDGKWNTNKRSPVVIKQDTIIVLTGNLQLIDYNLSDKGSYFEIICYGEFESLVKQIGDKTLNEINLDYYNHVYNFQTIRESWTKDYKSGFFYGLIDDGLGIAKLTGEPIKCIQSTTASRYIDEKDFKCCLYIKTIFDTILAEVGYSYESTVLNSLMFKNLIYYSNVKKLSKSSKNDSKTLFRVGLSADQDINNPFNSLIMGETVPYSPFISYRYQRGVYFGSQNLSYNDWDTISGAPVIYAVENIAKFNNEGFPNYDTYNNFDSTTFEYTNNSIEELNGRFYLHFRILAYDSYGEVYFQHKNDLEGYPRDVVVGIQLFRQFDPATGAQHPLWASGKGAPFPTYGGLNKYYLSVPEQTNYSRSMTYSVNQSTGVMTVDYTTDFYTDLMDGRDLYHRPIQPGERVRCVVQRLAFKNDVISTKGLTIKAESFMSNEPSSTATIGQVIDVSTLLDKSIKQKDFLSAIIKMFNLYIEEDQINKKKLLIESRDDYFRQGNPVDWTNKIDLSNDISETLLSNTQTLTSTFVYKDDKDYWNDRYKTEQNKSYGQFVFTSENEFIKGDKKVDTIFAPTILANVPNTLDNPLSNINKEVNSVGVVSGEVTSSPRILFRNMLPIGSSQDYFDVTIAQNIPHESTPDDFNNRVIYTGMEMLVFRMKTYPYIGHIDDPRNPAFDLNWGQTEYILYKLTNGRVTNNNLVNLYYNSLLRDLNHKNSRLLKMSLFLNSYDINNLRFNHKIYLNIDGSSQIYKLNKISNYNPNGSKSCEVELIKTIGVDYKLNDSPEIQTIYNGFDSPVGSTLPITTTQSFIPNYIKAGEDNILDEFSAVTINYITAGRDSILGLGSQTTTNKIRAGLNNIL